MNKIVRSTVLTIVLIIFGLILLSNALVVVQEDQYVLVKRFNQVVNVYEQSGIYLITPFVDAVDRLPKNISMYSIIETDVITKDRKAMTVD